MEYWEKKDIKVLIRGLNIDKWMTLKSYTNDLDNDEDEDYYINKCADSDKYNKFFQCQFTIMKEN